MSIKRFLFINMQTIKNFPNLNLHKYDNFQYLEFIEKYSHLAIYLNEDFDNFGIYYFKPNDLMKKLIDFNELLII